MEATKIRKDTFRHVEQELYAFYETKKEIIKLKNEILYASPVPDQNGGGRSNLPSNPTEKIVSSMMTNRKIQNLESIVEAIETVYNRLPKEKQNLINLYYWARPKMLTWDGIAQKLNVSRRQAIYWRDEIVYGVSETIGWR